MSKKQKRILSPMITLVVLALTSVALVVRRDMTAASAKPERTAALMIPNGSQAGSNESAEVELIDLRPSGFEPGEITRPAGRFLLGVNNRTGLRDLSLMLVHESGRSAGSKRLSKVKTWRAVLDLPPGHYVLREATHHEWLCHITITER